MDQVNILEGVQLSPIRKIPVHLGAVYHGLKRSEDDFHEFGEAYFSTVNQGAVKGWKKHLRMVSNLIVPVGAVRFVLFDDRAESFTKGQFMDVTLSLDNYYRLHIPPMLWMGFQGLEEDLNLLLNIASVEHDPQECLNADLNDPQIPFASW